MSFGMRVAQAALGLPFIALGYAAVKNPGVRVIAAEKIGVPHPTLAVQFNGAAMVVGGAALTANILPRAAAAGIAAALIPTTIAGHGFWNIDDPAARSSQKIHAWKNLGLIGGLLAVAFRPRR